MNKLVQQKDCILIREIVALLLLYYNRNMQSNVQPNKVCSLYFCSTDTFDSSYLYMLMLWFLVTSFTIAYHLYTSHLKCCLHFESC